MRSRTVILGLSLLAFAPSAWADGLVGEAPAPRQPAAGSSDET